MNMFGKTLQIGIASVALLLASGCDKPKEEECRRAVENILRLTGTQNAEGESFKPKAIRSCRGSSSKKSVQCVANAETVEELNKCSGGLVDSYIQESDEAEKKAREKYEKSKDKDEK